MDIPNPVCETEIAEMLELYDESSAEYQAAKRLRWLEVEYAKTTDENDFLQSNEESTHNAAKKVIAELKEALAELAGDPRTRDQVELVWRLKVRGLLK